MHPIFEPQIMKFLVHPFLWLYVIACTPNLRELLPLPVTISLNKLKLVITLIRMDVKLMYEKYIVTFQKNYNRLSSDYIDLSFSKKDRPPYAQN